MKRPFETGCQQGHGCESCLRASRRALGLNPNTRDIFESSTVRWIAALLAVIALCAVLDRFGIPMVWPT